MSKNTFNSLIENVRINNDKSMQNKADKFHKHDIKDINGLEAQFKNIKKDIDTNEENITECFKSANNMLEQIIEIKEQINKSSSNDSILIEDLKKEFATKEELAAKADATALQSLATKEELAAKADAAALQSLATKEELSQLATKIELDDIVYSVIDAIYPVNSTYSYVGETLPTILTTKMTWEKINSYNGVNIFVRRT